MDSTVIKPEVLKFHMHRYFNSLKNYPDRYLHLFFTNTDNPPDHRAYLCPLCLKTGIIVERSIGVGMHNEFSLDHYPPESVGGKQSILVCKKCNNDAGTLYDFSLKEKIQSLAFNRKIPAARIKSKSTITNVVGNYPSALSIGEKGMAEIHLKPNEKMHAPFLDQFIERSKTTNDYKIHLTMKIPDERKVSKALVKTAYLTCFEYWGYEFAFSNTGDMIRKFLNDECEYPTKNPSFFLGDAVKTEGVENLPAGLCYLKEPAEWKCFAVNFQLLDESSGFGEIFTILIPGPSKEDWEDLKRVQALLDANPQVDISMAHVIEDSITDNIADGYTKSWKQLTS